MGRSVPKKKKLNCVLCRQGEMRRGKTTVTLEKGRTTVVFKSVPAYVCDTCGDYEVTEKVADQLLKRTQAAVKNGAEVEILQFAA
jgi:YgiT-type zinc finger domain-containing protein